jgi:hypothetical protein
MHSLDTKHSLVGSYCLRTLEFPISLPLQLDAGVGNEISKRKKTVFLLSCVGKSNVTDFSIHCVMSAGCHHTRGGGGDDCSASRGLACSDNGEAYINICHTRCSEFHYIASIRKILANRNARKPPSESHLALTFQFLY